MFLATIPYPHMDPVLVQLGPFAIRWYALAYIAALLFAWWTVARAMRNKSLWTDPPFNGRPPATDEQIGDLVVWGTFGVILGGRLGWDLIYGVGLCSVSPDATFCQGLPYAFVTNPLKLIAAWEGGMSFHGGLLGVVLAVWLFCRKHKLAFLSVADLVCAFAPMGLFFGRLANFVNGELWGRITDVPWAMIFPRGGPLPRHPSQLYQATFEGILLFSLVLVVWRFTDGRRRPGLITGTFCMGYAVARIVGEIFREPDSFLGFILGSDWLTMGMLLSLPVLAFGAWLVIRAYRNPPLTGARAP